MNTLACIKRHRFHTSGLQVPIWKSLQLRIQSLLNQAPRGILHLAAQAGWGWRRFQLPCGETKTSASSVWVLASVQMGHCIICGVQECFMSPKYLHSSSWVKNRAKLLWRMNEEIRAIRGWGVGAAVRCAECRVCDWPVLSHFVSGDSI